MNPAFQPLIDQITADTAVKSSAVALINGFGDRVAKAVADALAGGATAQELADAVTAEVAAIKAGGDELAAAVAANTPAGPVVAAKKKP